MKRNKKINKLAVFFTISILEIVSVAGFIGYKSYLIGENVKTLHKETATLQEKTALAQVANDLEQQVSEKESEIEKDKKLFFEDVSLMNFLKNLYGTASVYNLSVNSISFGGLKDAVNTNLSIKMLPVSLSIVGNKYDDIVNFLSFLEKKGYSVKPNAISIRNSREIKKPLSAGGKAGAAVSLSLTIYVQTNSTGGWSYQGGG